MLTSRADIKKQATNPSFPAAKWLRTFGRTLALGIAWNKCKALCQWSAFSHALIAVLKVTTFGVTATWAVKNSQGLWSHQATVQEQCSKDDFIGNDQCKSAFDSASLCNFLHLRFDLFGHSTLKLEQRLLLVVQYMLTLARFTSQRAFTRLLKTSDQINPRPLATANSSP